jgi:4-hydroxybenzoate polyprenyltransferase
VANPRKGSAEGALVPPARARRVRQAIVLTNVPLILALGWLAGLPAVIAIALTALVAWLYSAPPLRTKERPVLDSFTSAMHFVLPAVCGFVVAGLPVAELPWALLLAFTGWGVASHAVGAVQDIAYDRAAGIGSVGTALGGRGVAVLALAGYGVAVVIVAMQGDAGLFAAAWLALYLILPLMLLVDPSERQARVAWRAFLGLNLLVGFVLTHLLLRTWEITRFTLTELLVTLALLPAALVLLNALLSLLVLRRPLPAQAGPAEAGPAEGVAIVVPSAGDGARLTAVLPALSAQRHPGTHVLVADAGPPDALAVAAARLLGERGEVLLAGEAPTSWQPRSWAAWQAVQAAGDVGWLLFTDTETTLDAHATGSLLAAARDARADLVSGAPRVAADTRMERIVAPGFGLLLHGFVPLWLVARLRGRPAALAFASSQLLLVRREAYLAAGGHAASRTSARPEVDLARTLVRRGRPLSLVHGAGLARTRLAPTVGAAFDLWRRALLPHAGGSAATALTAAIGTWLAWGLPVVLPFAGLAAGDAGLFAGGLAALAVMVAARIAVALLAGEDLRALAWHPVTGTLTPLLQVAGLAAALLRPVSGRSRRPAQLAPAGTAHPSGPPAR